ncbi:MAG: ABC transporter permease [Anaerolineae bacterium]|nr:ABC transporter permease [Anaerolineae bacterium]MDW8070334.1 ABC transporter permease [Anaerolineae bacterium]
MSLLESIRIALNALAVNKLRAALTMLGIIIGVGAVIALLSVGYGFEAYIIQQFSGLGSNLLFVFPGQLEPGSSPIRRVGQRVQPLTLGDAEAIADPFQVSGVVAVAAEYSRNGTIVRGNRELATYIIGAPPQYQSVRNFNLTLGEFISQEHVNARSRVAVLGAQPARRLFDADEYPIGQTVKLNDVPFRVIGVLAEKGGGPFGNQDNVVIIPISTAQTRLFRAPVVRGELAVSLIFIQAASQEVMDAVADQVTALLRERHRISFRDDDDFSIISQSDLIKVFGDFTAVFTIVLGAIAGISLVVGGIGIMNIMLVSVTERTREIGIRKAVGARRRDILLQFLVEAVVLALIGGALGIAFGYACSLLVAQLAGLNTIVRLEAILLATLFSAAVGLFFGIYPATRAAQLNPIDALRYE